MENTRLRILNNWVNLTIKNIKNPNSLNSDHLAIPPPCYLRILYPEEKVHTIHTVARFFTEVEAEAQRRYTEEMKHK